MDSVLKSIQVYLNEMVYSWHLYDSVGSPIKRHLSREKSILRVRKVSSSLRIEWVKRRNSAVVRRSPSWTHWSNRNCFPCIIAEDAPPTDAEGSTSFLPTRDILKPSTSFLYRSFFRICGVRLDGTSHPSGSRSTGKRDPLSSAIPKTFGVKAKQYT